MKKPALRRRGWLAQPAGAFDRLGPCGNVGLIIGTIAGILLTVLSLRTAHLRPAPVEVFWIIVILSLFCWLVLLFIGFVFLRLQLRSIFWGMLVRSVVICLFTVLIAYYTGAYRFSIILGIFVGLIFGYFLCVILKRVVG